MINLRHLDKTVLILLGASGIASFTLGVYVMLSYRILLVGLIAAITGAASIIITVFQTYVTRKREHDNNA
jgi:hypothetical protein